MLRGDMDGGRKQVAVADGAERKDGGASASSSFAPSRGGELFFDILKTRNFPSFRAVIGKNMLSLRQMNKNVKIMAQQMTINVEDPTTFKVLRNLFKRMEGVSVVPQARGKKKAEEEPDRTKAEILESIDSAFKELKLNLEGKLEFRPAEELLNEL